MPACLLFSLGSALTTPEGVKGLLKYDEEPKKEEAPAGDASAPTPSAAAEPSAGAGTGRTTGDVVAAVETPEEDVGSDGNASPGKAAGVRRRRRD